MAFSVLTTPSQVEKYHKFKVGKDFFSIYFFSKKLVISFFGFVIEDITQNRHFIYELSLNEYILTQNDAIQLTGLYVPNTF